MNRPHFWLSFGLVGALASCSGATPRGFEGTPQDNDGGGDQDGGTSLTDPNGDGGTPSGDGCSAEAKLVYVLSSTGDIYSFAPADKKFTKLGPLKCPVPQAVIPPLPISMSVDRKAIAWVNIRNRDTDMSTLYRVDLKTLNCTASKVTNMFIGGMGFSTDGTSGDQESLYFTGSKANETTTSLQRMTPDTQAVQAIGPLAEGEVEYTGTGDGRLYSFVVQPTRSLMTVDKATGKMGGTVALTGVPQPDGVKFAFSFWGGDFYFYTASTPTATTNVTRYRPSDKSLDTAYMKAIGFQIVGAGVSTCAPIVPPR